jgi:hypothetical protein
MYAKFSSRNPAVMKSLRRPRVRCDSTKKVDLKKAGSDYLKWVELTM